MKGMSYIEKTSFAGGLGDSEHPSEVGGTQVNAVQNCIYSGRLIRKRSGLKTYPTTQTNAYRVLGLGDLRTANGRSWKIMVTSDGVPYWFETDNWTAFAGISGLNASARWSNTAARIAANGVQIFTNGYDVPKKVTPPTSLTIIDSCDVVTGWSTTQPGTTPALNLAVKMEGIASIDLGSEPNRTIDNCDSVAAWYYQQETDPPTLDTVNFKQGTASIKLKKLSTGSVDSSLRHTVFATFDGTGLYCYQWFRIADAATLAKLDVTTAVYMVVNTNGSLSLHDAYVKTYSRAQLSVGWNLLGGLLSDFTPGSGGPNIAQITCYMFFWNTTNNSDTIAEGLMNIDDVYLIEGNTFAVSKTSAAPIDLSGKEIYTNVYIEDPADVATADGIVIKVGESNAKYFKKSYGAAALVAGWNQLGGALAGWTDVGTCNIAAIDYREVEVTHGAATSYITSGNIKTDYWYAGASAVPAWADLGGSPPRARYVVSFQNYIWLLNCKHRTDDAQIWPATAFISALGSPETGWSASYNFGQEDGYEITGAAVAGGVLVVFKEKGIYEVSYTGSSTLPFSLRPTVENVGAYHNTVVSCENFIMFANQNGVQAYYPGGRIQQPPVSTPFANTYEDWINDTNKKDALSACWNPDTGEYWLACGTTQAANDRILALDTETGAATIYQSAIPNVDITCLSVVYDTNVSAFVPWVGMNNGHAWVLSEVYDRAYDETQDLTPTDITAYFDTHFFDWNSPSMLKRLHRFNVVGKIPTSANVAVSVKPDGNAAVLIGNINLYSVTNQYVKKSCYCKPEAGFGRVFRIRLSETGGVSADTRWTVFSIGVEAMMRGIIGT
jgi:hypothetical protein